MLISKILDVHDQHRHASGLAAVLGDSYLLRHSSIYRNVRRAVLDRGFEPSQAPPFPYFTLPFLALRDIHAKRVLPYCDNVTAVRRLVRSCPATARLRFDDVLDTGLARNYLFHESVHAIAHRIIHAMRGGPRGKPRGHDRRAIVALLVEESCANAAEAVLAASRRERAFIQLCRSNCYFGYHHPVHELIRLAGVETAFEVAWLGALHANFLFRDLPATEAWRRIRRVVRDPSLPSIERRKVVAAFRVGFTLSVKFRLSTTAIYLRYLGFRKDIIRLLDFDFMPYVVDGGALEPVVHEMAAILTREQSG